MRVPVLIAVTGMPGEGDFVRTLAAASGIAVVRRCVDLADLLTAATTGTARAALLAGDLRRLDRDALARLAASGVAPVGVAASGDREATTRLARLGIRHVVPTDSGADAIAEVVGAAVRAGPDGSPGRAYADPREALFAGHVPADLATSAADDGVRPDGGAGAHGGEKDVATGRLIAVWGPTGAPGRTTVAVGLASELAAMGVSTVLADADVYGGVVAVHLGLLDESAGLAAAVRHANSGSLDLATFARLAPRVAPQLRVLAGLSRAELWSELRPAALGPVWAMCRRLASATVVDCGFSLEQEEELSFDVAAPRCNGATLLTLEKADTVVVVGSGDPVGLARLVRGLAGLRDAVPGATVHVVINRVRRGPIGADPQGQIAASLRRHAAVEEVSFIPYDRAGLDATMLRGRPRAAAAPASPARAALAALAAGLTGSAAPRRRRRFTVPRLALG